MEERKRVEESKRKRGGSEAGRLRGGHGVFCTQALLFQEKRSKEGDGSRQKLGETSIKKLRASRNQQISKNSQNSGGQGTIHPFSLKKSRERKKRRSQGLGNSRIVLTGSGPLGEEQVQAKGGSVTCERVVWRKDEGRKLQKGKGERENRCQGKAKGGVRALQKKPRNEIFSKNARTLRKFSEHRDVKPHIFKVPKGEKGDWIKKEATSDELWNRVSRGRNLLCKLTLKGKGFYQGIRGGRVQERKKGIKETEKGDQIQMDRHSKYGVGLGKGHLIPVSTSFQEQGKRRKKLDIKNCRKRKCGTGQRATLPTLTSFMRIEIEERERLGGEH